MLCASCVVLCGAWAKDVGFLVGMSWCCGVWRGCRLLCWCVLPLLHPQIQRTPKPLLSALVRSLHILGITGEGGAAAAVTNAISVHPLSGSGENAALANTDAGTSCPLVDAKESGRVWEGPWSTTERAIVATLSLPVRSDMAVLRRIATLTLAVETATVLR